MIKRLSKPFKWFFQLEAASGLVLLIAAIVALFISNSNLNEIYFNTLKQHIFISEFLQEAYSLPGQEKSWHLGDGEEGTC